MINREKIKYVIQEGQFTQLKHPFQAVTEKWLITPGVQHTMQNAGVLHAKSILLVKQRKSTRKKEGPKNVLSGASLVQEEYTGTMVSP